jgi:predicted RNase H-related nuclease YkuK (DUF458 family)
MWGFESLLRYMIDKYFKNEKKEIVDAIEYSLDMAKKHPQMKIHVATDSQNYGPITKYAIAIVYRYDLRGAHYIYKIVEVPRIRDHFMRLFQEAELSLRCAELIVLNTPLRVECVELDYNNEKKTISTKVVAAARGWAESLGFKTRVKPDEMMAAKAADHICRHK